MPTTKQKMQAKRVEFLVSLDIPPGATAEMVRLYVKEAEGLQALATALMTDDPRLIQGATTTPPPLTCVQDWPVEAGCLIAYPGVVECGGWGDATVCEVEEFFARICFEVDQLLGEPAACRWLLNWFDDTPRDEMRRLLLVEVNLALASRAEPETNLAAAI